MIRRHPRAIALFAPLVLAGLGLGGCGNGDAAGQANAAAVPAVPPPAGTAWSGVVRRTDEGGWLMGNPAAPIRLLEYGSLTCPACAAFANAGAEPLQTDYVDSGRVAFEFRPVMVHGTLDLVLTRLLECAPPEAGIALADQVWANLDTVTGPLQGQEAALAQAMQLPEGQRFVAYGERAGLPDFFAARGIARDATRACLADDAAVRSLAERAVAQADADEVARTPTFILNGRTLDETDWASIAGALRNAGARPPA